MLPILADATVIQDTPDSLGLLLPVDVSAVTEYVKLSFFGNIDNWPGERTRDDGRRGHGRGFASRYDGAQAESYSATDSGKGLS